MVTNGLQRNVHSGGFVVYLTDVQQLRAFILAVCVVVAVVAQRFSPLAGIS